MKLEEQYDVIIVGGGHAGCEAAHSAATLGSKVLLVTQNLETIARMSCNPAMGGVAKGQIIREIDALGGMSAIITDSSSIQFKDFLKVSNDSSDLLKSLLAFLDRYTRLHNDIFRII